MGILLPQEYKYKGFTLVYGTDYNDKGSLIVYDYMPFMEKHEVVVAEDKVTDQIDLVRWSFEVIVDKYLNGMIQHFQHTGRTKLPV